MTLSFRHFIRLTLLALPTLGLWSCGGGAADMPDAPADSKDVFMTIDVAVAEPRGQQDANAGARSRANEVSDITFFQLPERACEDLQTLRVIIFSAGKVEANRHVRFKDGAIVMDNLTFKVKPGVKDIALFGNESTLPDEVKATLSSLTPGTVASAQDLKEIVWSGRPLLNGNGSYKDGANYQYYTGQSAVPMSELWEGIEAHALENDETRRQYVNLFITRAVTQFSFSITKASDVGDGNWGGLSNHTIKSFTIDRIGGKEYLLPNNTVYIPEKDIASVLDFEGRFIESFDVPADDNEPSPFTFTPSTPYDVDAAPDQFTVMYAPYIYLPETLGPDFRCSITAVNKSSGEESTLFLPQTLPNLDSLPRNTHVIVNILLTPGGLKCTVDVQPYTSVSLNPTFGFDELLDKRPQYGEIPPWLEINPGPDDNYDPW